MWASAKERHHARPSHPQTSAKPKERHHTDTRPPVPRTSAACCHPHIPRSGAHTAQSMRHANTSQAKSDAPRDPPRLTYSQTVVQSLFIALLTCLSHLGAPAAECRPRHGQLPWATLKALRAHGSPRVALEAVVTPRHTTITPRRPTWRALAACGRSDYGL